MKIVVKETAEGFEVSVLDAQGNAIHQYHFGQRAQVNAFMSGFRCASIVAESFINSVRTLTQNYEVVKA